MEIFHLSGSSILRSAKNHPFFSQLQAGGRVWHSPCHERMAATTKEAAMKKTFLLLFILAGMTLTLSGCGPWGCWGGHGHNHGQNHAHYPGCGHPGY
jgi:hypothetical protein